MVKASYMMALQANPVNHNVDPKAAQLVEVINMVTLPANIPDLQSGNPPGAQHSIHCGILTPLLHPAVANKTTTILNNTQMKKNVNSKEATLLVINNMDITVAPPATHLVGAVYMVASLINILDNYKLVVALMAAHSVVAVTPVMLLTNTLDNYKLVVALMAAHSVVDVTPVMLLINTKDNYKLVVAL